ncbi:MAG: TonB-dependent receptor [Acidobacteriota bacterium]|nr:TonB-dependent receptor [Acidobacteriota bacterium]
MKKYFYRLAMILMLLAISISVDLAQTSRGAVSGTVKDQNGAVVPGATVTLVGEVTTVERSATTNDEGLYRFEAVDPGTYSVRVSAPNFNTALQSGVTVAANQTATIDAALQIGTQENVVEVIGTGGETLQTEAAVRGGNISTRQITDLPVASNPVSLALTIPGVVTNRTGVGIGTFSINGARGRSNNFLIDGTENNDISVAGQGFQITNQDAVQEVSVQTGNYDAEFGRAGGGVVNVITRAGTSDFHGTASFRYDTSTDDAITSAQSRNPAVLKLGRPIFNDEKVWSGTVGGPLFLPNFGEGGPVFNTARNKNFFFVAYQDNRFRSPGATVSLVTPTAAGRAVLQQFAGTNPNVANYLAATANSVATIVDQTPISLDATGGAQTRGSVQIGTFIRSYNSLFFQKQFQIRTDHNLSQNDQLSVRFLYDNQDQPLGGSAGFTGFDVDSTAKYRNFLIAETHIFSSTLTNELRLAYNRIQYAFPFADPTSAAATQPLINIPGLTNFGLASTFPQGRTADNYQVQDTVTKIIGNHTIRAGVDYLRQIATQIAPANTRGSVNYAAGGNFTGLGNFVDNFGGSATTSTGFVQRVFGNNVYHPTLHRVAAFGQDRWKVTDNLTLTLGLRYERFGEPFNKLRTPAFTGLFNVNPATRQGAFSEPNEVEPDKNNFAPTFGLVYSPSFTSGIGGFIFGERETAIRLGYNIGYDSFFNNIASNIVASSPNTIVTTNTSTVTAANPRGLPNFSEQFPTTAAVVLPTSTQTLVAPNLRNPYYQRWSLGVQRALPFELVMDVSYVGSKGTHLFINEDYNPLVRPELRVTPAGYPRCDLTGNATVTAAQATAQFPVGTPCPTTRRLDNIQGGRTVRTNGGSSYYHAGQFELRRRFADNFLTSVAYTFSKNINNADEVFIVGLGSGEGSTPSIPSIYGGQRANYALSVDDRPHRLALTYVVESPFFKEQQGILGRILGGFQLSGVSTFESGVPFSVTNGFDADGLGGTDRPTFNPNGQRGVRAVPVTDANGFITGYINPEIVIATNAAGAATAYQPIDPNTAQFIVNPTYTPGLAGSVVRTGNLGRNTERSPSVYNTNITLLKRTRISETIFIEARGELFNAFNQPNFPSRAADLITSNANSLTQGFFLNPDTANTSGGGRVVRYQLKLIF